MSSNSIRISIEPASTAYDPNDDRWTDQVDQLLGDLRTESVPIEQDVTAVDGQKGGIISLIAVLGSSGAITAATAIFKSWLSRDKTRRIKLAMTDANGDKREIELDADGLSKGEFEQYSKLLLDQMNAGQ